MVAAIATVFAWTFLTVIVTTALAMVAAVAALLRTVMTNWKELIINIFEFINGNN